VVKSFSAQFVRSWLSRRMMILALACGFVIVPMLAPVHAAETNRVPQKKLDVSNLIRSTGLYNFSESFKQFGEEDAGEKDGLLPEGIGQLIMIMVGCGLIYLAIAKGFEPLLLLPIGFGGILANVPAAGIAEPGGFLHYVYNFGIIPPGLFPLLIFMGVGAMTDFGPLIANPKTALLGAAAQFGIFFSLIGALWLSNMGGIFESISFTVQDAAAIGIIGGADGPTAIFLAGRLAPDLLGAIAVAAYSYMALVPIIQPPIMRLLTTEQERKIEMKQLRHVSKMEKIVFPLVVLFLCILLLPEATPLIGMLMFGNLIKESGVVERLSKTAQNELINIVTILLGLAVGSKLAANKFLQAETLGILTLGLIAFAVGTASGVLIARLMNLVTKEKINPLIGAAGVSAVPMAARVVNKEGLKANPHNFLLMHAMGPNVAGVIGSAVAAGVLLSLCGK
jgi:oxaloacetate decarboxylase beta subunit